MITETYTCALANGLTEYGYTFKKSAEHDDTEFDIPLGQSNDAETIEQGWESFRSTAEKIAAALGDEE